MQNGERSGKDIFFKSSRYRCSRNSRQTRSIRSRHARANVSPPARVPAYSILSSGVKFQKTRRGAALSRERRSSDFAEVPLRPVSRRIALHLPRIIDLVMPPLFA